MGDGREDRPGQPAWKLAVLVGGLVLLLVGAVAIYLGLKPLAPLLELFTGGAQAAEKNQEFMDHLQEHLNDAALPVGGGIAALLAGFVMVKVGLSPPKPPTVEEIVDQRVQERLQGLGLAQTPASAAPAPMAPTPTPIPAPATPPRPAPAAPVPAQPAVVASAPPARACPKCGGRLAAGGRVCVSCRATFP